MDFICKRQIDQNHSLVCSRLKRVGAKDSKDFGNHWQKPVEKGERTSGKQSALTKLMKISKDPKLMRPGKFLLRLFLLYCNTKDNPLQTSGPPIKMDNPTKCSM